MLVMEHGPSHIERCTSNFVFFWGGGGGGFGCCCWFFFVLFFFAVYILVALQINCLYHLH